MRGVKAKRLRKEFPFKGSRRRVRRGRLVSKTSAHGHGERTVVHVTSTNKYTAEAHDASRR